MSGTCVNCCNKLETLYLDNKIFGCDRGVKVKKVSGLPYPAFGECGFRGKPFGTPY